MCEERIEPAVAFSIWQNLDGATSRELWDFMRWIGTGSRLVCVSDIMFGDRLLREVAVRQLRNYAWCRWRQLHEEEKGNHETAADLRDQCDAIYESLPDWGRWTK